MSLRLVKSPDAPKITITHGSAGRPAPRRTLEAISSASCILHLSVAPLNRALTLRQCFCDRRLQRRQATFHIMQVHPERPPLAIGQNLKIAAGLRGLYHAEGELLPRYRDVGLIVARHLQEHAAVRSAFVGLTRRV